MAISEYQGPANHVGVLKHLVGEVIKAAFVDQTGRVWVVVQSGHAIVFGGFDRLANAFDIVDPAKTSEEIEKRKKELQAHIQDLRWLAPGVDV